jgi:thiol-disulfide isomerase/thioredoxin
MYSRGKGRSLLISTHLGVHSESLLRERADGSCKKLRPSMSRLILLSCGLMIAYDKLAEELKDKVNIVAVDCDAHRALCTSNGVKGFPTIKMYVPILNNADDRLENGKSNEYSGSRSLDKLKEFALKSVKP